MTADRATAIRTFLTDQDWDNVRVDEIDGDASLRRYLRLWRREHSAILMDASPEHGEDVHPFAAMTHWLREQGLSAPEIYAGDYLNGLLLLEDLGDDLYSQFLAKNPEDEHRLYAKAIDVLVQIARASVPRRLGVAPYTMTLPPYNLDVLLREAMLMPHWWIPAVTNEAAGHAVQESYRTLMTGLCRDAGERRDVIVLRDFHADNLLWLPDREGTARVGLLDYQDGVAGHPAYDLVSLLEDARRDTTTEMREAMITYYLQQRPELDQEAFLTSYAILGAQRNLKIIGIFTRLAVRDGKLHYLGLIPRVWKHLLNDLGHPALRELRAWVMANMPKPTPENIEAVRHRGQL